MKVTKEKTGSCEYLLTLEVETERLAEPLRQAARRLNQRRPIPGFRPGKAPYAMVERVFGKEFIYDEALDKLGNDLYQEALKQSETEPYAQAKFEIAQLEPLTLKVTVPTPPEVTLGDYHQIHVQKATASVSEQEVSQVLDRLQEDHAVWVPVERASQMGDEVLVDAVGNADDGKGIEQLDLALRLSEELQPREFAQHLVGVRMGESKDFDVEYSADSPDPDLAGKRFHFHATAKAVREKELPPLDDALAKSVGKYETLEQLRAEVQKTLLQQKESAAHEAAEEAALDALVEQATIQYPAVAVENEIAAMLASFTNRLEQQGFTLESYLRLSKQTETQWREATRPRAEKRLKRSLALTKLAEAESIALQEADVKTEVERLASSFGEDAEAAKAALSTEESLRSISVDVLSRKVLAHLLEIATGQTVAAPTTETAVAQPEGAKAAVDASTEPTSAPAPKKRPRKKATASSGVSNNEP